MKQTNVVSSNEMELVPAQPTMPTEEEREKKNRSLPETMAMHALHDDVVALKGRTWEYVLLHVSQRFVGGPVICTKPLRDEVLRVADVVAERGSLLQQDVARHTVTKFAAHAKSICKLDALDSMSAMVRVHELYLASQPILWHLVQEWIQVGSIAVDLKLGFEPRYQT